MGGRGQGAPLAVARRAKKALVTAGRGYSELSSFLFPYNTRLLLHKGTTELKLRVARSVSSASRGAVRITIKRVCKLKMDNTSSSQNDLAGRSFEPLA